MFEELRTTSTGSVRGTFNRTRKPESHQTNTFRLHLIYVTSEGHIFVSTQMLGSGITGANQDQAGGTSTGKTPRSSRESDMETLMLLPGVCATKCMFPRSIFLSQKPYLSL